MRYLSFLLLFVLCSVAFSQEAELILPSEKVHVEEGIAKKNGLEDLIKTTLGYAEDIQLVKIKTIDSKALTHHRYEIEKDGLKIFGASVHVAQEKSGKIKFIQAPAIKAGFAEEQEISAGAEHLVKSAMDMELITEVEIVWIKAEDGKFRKAKRMIASDAENLQREVIVKNTEIIYENDLLEYFKKPTTGPDDTAVYVRVFDPDPLTTAQVNYGGAYIDDDDKNSSALHNERRLRSTILTFKGGEFKLENDHVKIVEFSAPVTPVSIAPAADGSFDYSRDTSLFEDINVIYHITKHCKHLEYLGYANLPGYQIPVDAHAFGGMDQSAFGFNYNPPRLYFGEGGVDDAEDADVILHEFSHAIFHAAAQNQNKTTQRKCIEEALADYFAFSYSRALSTFNMHDVFNWDGHNPFFFGRYMLSNKYYDSIDFRSNDLYRHVDLMAAPLVEIHDKLGRIITDQLVLEAAFNLTSATTMPDMANFILMSDSLLNNGANAQVILDAFGRRHILDNPVSVKEFHPGNAGLRVLNSYGFAQGGELLLKSEEELEFYELYNIRGQRLRHQRISGASETYVSPEGLAPGVYVLKVKTRKGSVATFKLSKAVY